MQYWVNCSQNLCNDQNRLEFGWLLSFVIIDKCAVDSDNQDLVKHLDLSCNIRCFNAVCYRYRHLILYVKILAKTLLCDSIGKV